MCATVSVALEKGQPSVGPGGGWMVAAALSVLSDFSQSVDITSSWGFSSHRSSGTGVQPLILLTQTHSYAHCLCSDQCVTQTIRISAIYELFEQ